MSLIKIVLNLTVAGATIKGGIYLCHPLFVCVVDQTLVSFGIDRLFLPNRFLVMVSRMSHLFLCALRLILTDFSSIGLYWVTLKISHLVSDPTLLEMVISTTHFFTIGIKTTVRFNFAKTLS